MRNFAIILISILLMLAACSTTPGELDFTQQITQDNPELQDLIQDPDSNQPRNPIGSSLVDQFQTPYINPDNVKILESNMVEWPDSCLGIDLPGTDCLQQTTPGYAVLLEAKGLKFAYHANEVGSQFHPATQGLMWTREDDQGGVCDRLIIYLPDTALACWCRDGEMYSETVNLQDILSEEEYETMINALRTFSENSVHKSPPEGASSVMVSLNFHGQGSNFPNSDQQESLIKIADMIFSRIAP